MTDGAESATERSDEHVYRIVGGRPLTGTVQVQGAKNAIGKQLVASVLTREPCTFTNVPRIREVDIILSMLSDIGLTHEWVSSDTLRVHTPAVTRTDVRQEYSGANRIPILLLAPIHHVAGTASVPLLGGCRIGPRPVDFHIHVLQAMGGRVSETEAGYLLDGPPLAGTSITLPYPSVGATETALLAAVTARGRTVIRNAAIEPEVMDTILFLQKMGALIFVDVDRTLIVDGVSELSGTSHRVLTDRIEVASFAALAAATDGRITVYGAEQEHLVTLLNILRRTGGGFSPVDGGLTFFRAAEHLNAVHFDTDVHPGFMTDWQQPFTVMLTQAHGASVIHETVYEDRFGYTAALRDIGARIQLSSDCLGNKECRFRFANHAHSCIVVGPSPLTGGHLEMPDLRAGFAYLTAALLAQGESSVSGISYLERGYANIPDKLQALGAQIAVTEVMPVAALH